MPRLTGAHLPRRPRIITDWSLYQTYKEDHWKKKRNRKLHRRWRFQFPRHLLRGTLRHLLSLGVEIHVDVEFCIKAVCDRESSSRLLIDLLCAPLLEPQARQLGISPAGGEQWSPADGPMQPPAVPAGRVGLHWPLATGPLVLVLFLLPIHNPALLGSGLGHGPGPRPYWWSWSPLPRPHRKPTPISISHYETSGFKFVNEGLLTAMLITGAPCPALALPWACRQWSWVQWPRTPHTPQRPRLRFYHELASILYESLPACIPFGKRPSRDCLGPCGRCLPRHQLWKAQSTFWTNIPS